jgi:hypothetical protein
MEQRDNANSNQLATKLANFGLLVAVIAYGILAYYTFIIVG